MAELTNTALLLGQAVLYFTVMMMLLHARRSIGIGVFMCALGTMHFLETYLASVFYVAMPFGAVSPGSAVLFAGKLMMLLLLYIREDAVVARQPIYGLLFGNFLIVGLVLLLQHQDTIAMGPSRLPDIGFVNEIGWLMVWGTVLLYIDAIAIIVLYERLGPMFGGHLGWRFLVCGAAVLTFDQAGFYLVLHLMTGAPLSVFMAGWIAKMCAVLIYTALFVLYLKFFDDEKKWLGNRSFKDAFQMLTYRERYEQLLEDANRDALTGAFHRRHYEQHAGSFLKASLDGGRPLTMVVIDIDYFKGVNDRHGHHIGDDVLRQIANLLSANLRSGDFLYRFGGEEFVLLCDQLPAEAAVSMAERMRRHIENFSEAELPERVTVSVGVATAPEDGATIEALFQTADKRLYEAKRLGRNRVCGPVFQD
ncbi:GGDEF domain-containing protein [Roseibium aquae]|uniref:diguanylate cyclase n=1 Tax=Roseibium aquae TaxID=1323746 RepID=A0A916T8U8_9HYPH|nr:GGDEF domain-containing protein [Roseibium aquae]GGB36195.1 GGDEF domain-containing protein [Roseibium aquae]